MWVGITKKFVHMPLTTSLFDTLSLTWWIKATSLLYGVLLQTIISTLIYLAIIINAERLLLNKTKYL